MLIKLLYDPAKLFVRILAVLTSYYNTLSEIPIATEYTSPGYVTDSFVFSKSAEIMNYKEASSYCLTVQMDLFTPTKDMNLADFFKHFETTSVWTQIYQHTISETLVNMDQKTPVTATTDQVIALPNILIPTGYLIALSKGDDGKTFFDPQIVTKKLTAVCMTPILYPNRTMDRTKITELRKYTLEDLFEQKENTEKQQSRIRRKILTVPNYGSVKNLEETLAVHNRKINMSNARDFVRTIEKKLLELETFVPQIETKWKEIETNDDLPIILQMHNLFNEKFQNTLRELQEPLLHPTSTIQWEDRDRIDPTYGEPKIGISENAEEKYFFIYLYEAADKEQLPIESTLHVLDFHWEGFFKISFPDMIFSIGWILQIATFLVLSLIRFNRQIKKMCTKRFWQRKSSKSSINSEKQYRVRKIMAENSSDTQKALKRSRSFSVDHELEVFRPKKRPAPKPPKSKVRIEATRYIPPSKPKNEPQYMMVRVINDNLPVADGISDSD